MEFPYTHEGRTNKPIRLVLGQTGPVGGFSCDVDLPLGTPCRKLPDGRWVVHNLGMAGNILLCSLSTHPGVPIDERHVHEIVEVNPDAHQARQGENP